MTGRIQAQLNFFVNRKDHHQFRQDIPVDISDILNDPSLTDEEKNARAHARVLRSETPVVFYDERIACTRSMLHLPKWEHAPVNTDKYISHMLNEPTLGGISNNVADYGHTIEVGLEGRRDEINRVLQTTLEAGDREGVAFLKNALFLIDEIESFADRIQAQALKVGNQTIYEAFAEIPRRGAKTFAQALQFLRFLNFVLRYENDTHSPLGRFDQYMYPYFKADMDSGRLSYDEAFELLCEYFISLNRDSDLYFGIQQGDNGQAMVLGGVDSEGRDAYNPLSEICIRASLELGIIDPKINLRVSRDTPLAIFELGSELTKKGLGFPQYSNDDVVIPALTKWGYDLKDARNYAVAGCWEFVIPDYGAEVVNIEAMPFIQVVDRCARQYLRQSESFDEFMAHFKDGLFAEADKIADRFSDFSLRPSTIHSILSRQAIGNARDISKCGKYHNIGIHGPGISNTVDALAAVKKYVFDEKTVSADDLISALDSNFEGHEQLWRKLRYEAPKMGNHDDYADEIAAKVIDLYADSFEGRKNCFGGGFRPGTGSAMYYMWFADEVGATPDGRRAGEPLSANYSPSLNIKVKGPVSMFQSFTKPDLRRVCNGGPVTMELSDSLFRNGEAIEKVAGLVQFFIQSGGHQLQLNAVNGETLRSAQKDPSQYRNLVVRVWGWSGYFVELSKEYQDHIITRTEMTV